MGCASCFPAAASFGSARGLSFLAAYESLFINTLLPLFALFTLILQAYIGWQNKKVLQGLLGVSGPLFVLATLYFFWTDDWSTYLLYSGLIMMFGVSIWQWFSQPKHCSTHISGEI